MEEGVHFHVQATLFFYQCCFVSCGARWFVIIIIAIIMVITIFN